MSSSTAGPEANVDSKPLSKHEQVLFGSELGKANPKYTQTFFPTPGHTPAPGIHGRYTRSLCLSVLEGTTWMKEMKEIGWIKVKKGKLRFSSKWIRSDPVTTRLKGLPDIAQHYEERLGGYTRYGDIPPGSEYAKRWRKYQNCPRRKWALVYIALKRTQADNSSMVPDCVTESASAPSILVDSADDPIDIEERTSTPKRAGRRRKRAYSRPDTPPLPSPSKRIRVPDNRRPPSSSQEHVEVIHVPDSDDDEPILIRSNIKRTIPFTVINSDTESDESIRSVSPPMVTLPGRSFALSPKRVSSPINSHIADPRLGFQSPVHDTPTDSEDEPDENSRLLLPGLETYDTTNDMLLGMFTNHNLKPQQAWRNGLPTPPDSRGSGSVSPIKRVEGWERVITPEPELDLSGKDIDTVVDTSLENTIVENIIVAEQLEVIEGEADSREDMDVDTSLDADLRREAENDRPTTPPLLLTLSANRTLVTEITSIDSPPRIGTPNPTLKLIDDQHVTPPLPDHIIDQSIIQAQQCSDVVASEDTFRLRTDAERAIANRLLETLITDQALSQLAHGSIPARSTSPTKRELANENDEIGDGATSDHLVDWFNSHTEAGSSTIEVKGKQKEANHSVKSLPLPKPLLSDVFKVNDTSSSASKVPKLSSHIIAASIPTITSHQSTKLSTIPIPNPINSPFETPHSAGDQFTSSILDLLIAQSSSKPKYLLDHTIAFSPQIPFKASLIKLVEVSGGRVLDQSQIRAFEGERFIVYPIGSRMRRVKGVQYLDLLGFMEVLKRKIGGSC